jgi:hypothetical protein
VRDELPVLRARTSMVLARRWTGRSAGGTRVERGMSEVAPRRGSLQLGSLQSCNSLARERGAGESQQNKPR